MCQPYRKLRYRCTSRLQLRRVLARDAAAAVLAAAKEGVDVEVEAARCLQMPCAAPEQMSHQ